MPIQSSSVSTGVPGIFYQGWESQDEMEIPQLISLDNKESDGSKSRRCAVCHEEASGMYFGALVCLPCKSFFIRSTKDGVPSFTCLVNGSCDVTHGNRLRCQYCRFKKCIRVGMCRKEKPEIIQPAEGQVLCRVCHDIANGVHFGVPTCEGCKKFFRRALKESNTYFCKFKKMCAMNPRNRNSCRYCRFQRCTSVGMSRNAIRMGRPKKVSLKDMKTFIPDNQYSRQQYRSSCIQSTTNWRRQEKRMEHLTNQDKESKGPSNFSTIPHDPYMFNNEPQALATNSTDIQENSFGLQGSIQQSVIRSCGNPQSITMPQFGDTTTKKIDYLSQTTDIGVKDSLESPLKDYCGKFIIYTDTEFKNNMQPEELRDANPSSDDSSSFNSDYSDKILSGIGNDLADIISNLNQYNNAIHIKSDFETEDMGPNSSLIYKNCSSENNQDFIAKLDTVLKQEPNSYQNDCQYSDKNNDGTLPWCSAEHMFSNNQSMKPPKTVVACIGSPSDIGPNSTSMISHTENTISDVLSQTQATGPCHSSGNLFSQMFNSLLLTYNACGNNYGETQFEDNRSPLFT